MKFLIHLFSVYLLTLACLTCACADIKEDKNLSQANIHHPAQHQDQDDSCTPFCSCTCCPATAYFYLAGCDGTNREREFVTAAFAILVDPGFSSYTFHKIWQPPKARA